MGSRVLLSLSDAQIDALKSIGDMERKPRAAIIRDAIQKYIAQHECASVEQDVFGLWKNNLDGLKYQQKLRSEW